MQNTPTITWPGKSGANYPYWIYRIGTPLNNVPGNYIYARETAPNSWVAVYIGQTDDLGRRLANHEVEARAKRHGATHIHAHTNEHSEVARLDEEADLCARWKPVCNQQLV